MCITTQSNGYSVRLMFKDAYPERKIEKIANDVLSTVACTEAVLISILLECEMSLKSIVHLFRLLVCPVLKVKATSNSSHVH